MSKIKVQLHGIPFSADEVLEGDVKKLKVDNKEKVESYVTLSVVIQKNQHCNNLLKEIVKIQKEVLEYIQKNSNNAYHVYKNFDKGINNSDIRFHCSLVNFATYPNVSTDGLGNIADYKKLKTYFNYINLPKIICKFGYLYGSGGSIALQLFFSNSTIKNLEQISDFAKKEGYQESKNKLYPIGIPGVIPCRGVINIIKIFKKDAILDFDGLNKYIRDKNKEYFGLHLSDKGLPSAEIDTLSFVVSDPWLNNNDYQIQEI